jgi:hypothetical protein
MHETWKSLLLCARAGEEHACEDLTRLYRPRILGWLPRPGVPAGDLDDLSQDVLLSAVPHLPSFQHPGRRGALRSWRRPLVGSRTTARRAGPGAPGYLLPAARRAANTLSACCCGPRRPRYGTPATARRSTATNSW